MVRIDLATGDAKCAETLCPEAVEGRLEDPARFGIDRQVFAILRRVSIGQSQQVFRRSLDHEPPFGSVLDQDRDAPSLEIERNFVKFLPAGQVERMGAKYCFVERTLHADIESAIDRRIRTSCRALHTMSVDHAEELDRGFRQRPGLVGA
jgi:hypothetical protein